MLQAAFKEKIFTGMADRGILGEGAVGFDRGKAQLTENPLHLSKAVEVCLEVHEFPLFQLLPAVQGRDAWGELGLGRLVVVGFALQGQGKALLGGDGGRKCVLRIFRASGCRNNSESFRPFCVIQYTLCTIRCNTGVLWYAVTAHASRRYCLVLAVLRLLIVDLLTHNTEGFYWLY